MVRLALLGVVLVLTGCFSNDTKSVKLAQAQPGRWYFVSASVRGETLSREAGGSGQSFLPPNTLVQVSPPADSFAVKLIGKEGATACTTPEVAKKIDRWGEVDHPIAGSIEIYSWTTVGELSQC
jgi:hypothetical protein